jgi:hypothetical protein
MRLEVMRLILNPKHADKTYLGYEWLEPISYGYDSKGFLKTILCKAPLNNNVELVDITGQDIGEDLMMNYTVDTRPCIICGTDNWVSDCCRREVK